MNMRILTITALFGVLLTSLQSEERVPTEEESKAEIQKLVDSLNYQQGKIFLKNNIATLDLPAEFRYLSPKDAAKVLEELWGNPPSGESLGMLVPASPGLNSPDSWAILISYSQDGYVKDDDAEKIDYAKLMTEMQKDTKSANKERERSGYEPVELVGWAAPPTYDKEARKLYWAKELKFGDDSHHTLNYNIRALGRRGVLVLNVIAGVNQLPEIQAATPQILSMVAYSPGHRYEDFDSKTDQVATYGIAALVAGGIAAKAGFFKGLIALIIAGKKFLIIGVIALGVWIKNLFAQRKNHVDNNLRQ